MKDGLNNNGQSNENKVFINIVAGKFAKKVTDAHPNAVSRVNKKGETVYEEMYETLSGEIKDFSVEDIELGGNKKIRIFVIQIRVGGTTYVVNLPWDSRITERIVWLLPMFYDKGKIMMKPFDFNDNATGKRRVGCSIYLQDDTGLYNVKLVTDKGWSPKGWPKFPDDWTDQDTMKEYQLAKQKCMKAMVKEYSDLRMRSFVQEDNKSPIEKLAKNRLEASDNTDIDDLPF